MFLGDRLIHGRGYSTVDLERVLPAGYPRPEYLRAPLFKHPPLFPLMVGMSRATFSGKLGSAFYPSLLIGAGLIVAVFYLALALDVGPGLSLLTALFVAASPVAWICSARIWMDVALAFFVLAAVGAQVRGLANARWFLMMGLCWGCAMLSKYPAGAGWLAALASGLLIPEARRSRLYWAGHGLALCLIGTWFLVRCWFEGWKVVFFWQSEVQDWRMFGQILRQVWVVPVGLAAVLALRRWVRGNPRAVPGALLLTLATITLAVAAGLGAWRLWSRLPWHGWGANALIDFGRIFYLVYPVVFDPILWVGLFGLIAAQKDTRFDPVAWTWLGLFAFVTLWGNYQSRYGLPLMPLQAVLAVLVVKDAWQRPVGFVAGQRLLAAVWVAASLARSLWVDWHLALSNDFFYF